MPDQTKEIPGFVTEAQATGGWGSKGMADSEGAIPEPDNPYKSKSQAKRMAVQKPSQPVVPSPPIAETETGPQPSQNLVLTFPGGSKIELGERTGPEGPHPFVSLSSPNEPDIPSLTLWIDPISSQPMITLRCGPGWYQSYPLDKKLASPYGKSSQ